MPGVNRADLFYPVVELLYKTYGAPGEERPCVFLSYQHGDFDNCKKIADYLLGSGLDIFFDEYDKGLSKSVSEGDPDKVTEIIQKGIERSTHMLCVISSNTSKSHWVPFEVGYGDGKLKLGVLTLKDFSDGDLPGYMKTSHVVRGTKFLNQLVSELLEVPPHILEKKSRLTHYSAGRHPLDNVLKWDK